MISWKRTWAKVVAIAGGGSIAFSSLFMGCATPNGQISSTGGTNTSTTRLLDEHSATQEVEDASRLAKQGQSTAAIPRLLQVISQYPDTKAALDARYWLGITYYDIRSYKDSLNVLNEYVKMAPTGQHAKEAREFITRISAEYNEKFPGPEQLDARITELTDQLRADSSNLAKQWELADLMWKRGDYDSSARIYVYIVAHHPEYANDATVKSRVERLPNGDYIPLTPAEVLRRQAKAQPLLIFNENSFRSGTSLLTLEKKYYVVTGQVVNQGDSILYGVNVTVTIYGFGSVVYDTNVVSIGRLNPGETRAFSTRFRNFENMENIDRFECVGTFQR